MQALRFLELRFMSMTPHLTWETDHPLLESCPPHEPSFATGRSTGDGIQHGIFESVWFVWRSGRGPIGGKCALASFLESQCGADNPHRKKVRFLIGWMFASMLFRSPRCCAFILHDGRVGLVERACSWRMAVGLGRH